MQLKKADEKHSKYTLVVESDDKKIEKKDKSLDEAQQKLNELKAEVDRCIRFISEAIPANGNGPKATKKA